MKKFLNFVFDHTTKKVAGAVSIILALAVLCLGLLTETGRHVVSFLGFVGFIVGCFYGGYRLYKYTTENARKEPKVYDDEEEDEIDDGDEDDEAGEADTSDEEEVPAAPVVRRPRSAKRTPAGEQTATGERQKVNPATEQKPAKKAEDGTDSQTAEKPKTGQTRKPRTKANPKSQTGTDKT